jgi:hypothetical protein
MATTSGANDVADGAPNGSVNDATPLLEICTNRNFQELASKNTSIEEFSRLLTENVVGYFSKKRVMEGMKDLLPRVETAENKLYLSKHLGKAMSRLEGLEKTLTDRYEGPGLKAKIVQLNADMQAMLDSGRVSPEEKPLILQELHAKRTAAKAAEKAKTLEKVEKSISAVSKATPVALPLPDLEEPYRLHLDLVDIAKIEAKPPKALHPAEKALLAKKTTIETAMNTWSKANRNWFETEFEFKPRLETALQDLVKKRVEERKREEEEAIEKQRWEEEQALIAKRNAQLEAEERRAKELETRLEVKRLEAALKPQKAVPQQKKKEKVKGTKLAPHEFFEEQPVVSEPEEIEELPVEKTDAKPTTEAPKATTTVDKKAPEPVAPPKPTPAPPPPKPVKVVKPKPVLENKWGDSAEVPLPAEFQEEGDDVGPSLADAVAAAAQPSGKKGPVAQPKKKEKKKFAKVSTAELGFDANNPNYR